MVENCREVRALTSSHTIHKRRALIRSIFMGGLLFLVSPNDANAYIDPGLASYIFQLILAFLLGISFAIRVYWRKIKLFFSSFFSKGEKVEDDDK